MSGSPVGSRSLLRAWHAAVLPGIIRPMMASRFTLRRMTATLLPLTFLWLCVACAFICGRETAASSGHAVPSSVERTEAKGAPACDGCPFASFPKATAPERAAFDAGSQAMPAEAPPKPSAYSQTAAYVRLRGQARPTTPPLQLLPTLRI